MPFVFTLDGKEFNSDDLTVDDAVQIEQLMDKSWLDINPILHGAAFRAMGIVFLSKHMDKKAAESYMGKLRIKDTMDHVRWVEEDDLPDVYEDGIPKASPTVAADGTSTAGSAGHTSSSDGLPASPVSRQSVTSSS